MSDFSQLFLYIPGIIIFLIGSGGVRTWLGMKRLGAFAETTVISSQHVIKKDRQDREVFNYYNTVVEYVDAKTGRTVRKTVKAPTEFSVGQQVKLIFEGNRQGEPVLVEHEDESLFGPWTTMVGGALMILLALFQNQGKQVPAMCMLVLLLLGAGASLLYRYFNLKSRGLQPIQAVVKEVYTRQISKETKIVRGSKFAYYPIVTYELNGRENTRRCNVNSSGEKSYKPGDKLQLYYDPKSRIVVEQGAKVSILVWGVILLVLGAMALFSMIPVLMGM
jgi:uncharacterized membrane-anchored protein